MDFQTYDLEEYIILSYFKFNYIDNILKQKLEFILKYKHI